jgi:hypothetical protein
LSDPSSNTAHETVSLQDNNDSAILAETSLVSGIATNVSGPSNQASNMAKPFTATKLANFPSKSGSVQTDCMAAINREFRAKGFSKKVRKLLTASWRSGTQKIMLPNLKDSVAGVVRNKLIRIQHL